VCDIVVENHVGINLPDGLEITNVQMAVGKGNLCFFFNLIDRGADVNFPVTGCNILLFQILKTKPNMADHLFYAIGSNYYFPPFIAEEYVKIDQVYFLPNSSHHSTLYNGRYTAHRYINNK
jgi:hypothetical protein